MEAIYAIHKPIINRLSERNDKLYSHLIELKKRKMLHLLWVTMLLLLQVVCSTNSARPSTSTIISTRQGRLFQNVFFRLIAPLVVQVFLIKSVTPVTNSVSLFELETFSYFQKCQWHLNMILNQFTFVESSVRVRIQIASCDNEKLNFKDLWHELCLITSCDVRMITKPKWNQ